MHINHIRVHGERALVKIHPKKEERTAGGLIKPQTTGFQESTHGTILSLGKENRDLSVGDEIIWNPFAQATITEIDGIKYGVVNYIDILVTLKD